MAKTASTVQKPSPSTDRQTPVTQHLARSPPPTPPLATTQSIADIKKMVVDGQRAKDLIAKTKTPMDSVPQANLLLGKSTRAKPRRYSSIRFHTCWSYQMASDISGISRYTGSHNAWLVFAILLLLMPAIAVGQEPLLSIIGNSTNRAYTTSSTPPTMNSSEILFSGTGTGGSSTCQFLSFGSLSLTMSTTGITITTIFQFEGSPRDYEHVFQFGLWNQISNDILLRRLANSDRLLFQHATHNAYPWWFSYAPSAGFRQNAPIRLAIQYNPNVGTTGLLSFWVNGIQIESFAPNTRAQDRVVSDSFLGRSTYSSEICSSMRLYSFRIHNRVLSEAEIRNETMTLRSDLPVVPPRSSINLTNSARKSDLRRNNSFHLRSPYCVDFWKFIFTEFFHINCTAIDERFRNCVRRHWYKW